MKAVANRCSICKNPVPERYRVHGGCIRRAFRRERDLKLEALESRAEAINELNRPFRV